MSSWNEKGPRQIFGPNKKGWRKFPDTVPLKMFYLPPPPVSQAHVHGSNLLGTKLFSVPFGLVPSQTDFPASLYFPGLGIRSSVFWANRLFLRKNERMSNLLKKTSDSLIHSFLVSNLSDLLTSLIFGERPEWFAHIAHKKRGNEWIANFFK